MEANKIVFIGATKNFFKVGHCAIKTIIRQYPHVPVRLALPDISDAAKVLEGYNVELLEWNPKDNDSMRSVFSGCSASLLVPPIHNRVVVAKRFIQIAKEAGIQYLACMGVQFDDEQVQISRDAKEVNRLLTESNLKYSVL